MPTVSDDSRSSGSSRLAKSSVGRQRAQRRHRRLAAERLQIGADEAVRDRGEPVEIDVVGERHAARVDLEDLAPAGRVGNADLDLAVEAAGTAQRRVERVGQVGGGDHDHLAARA